MQQGSCSMYKTWLGIAQLEWKKETVHQGTMVSKHSSGLGVEIGFNYVRVHPS